MVKSSYRKGVIFMQQFTLKVYPVGRGRDVYRIISISGQDTLDQLCSVILTAFDFSQDHLYEFCMDNRPYSEHSYQCEEDGSGRPLTTTKIAKLDLAKGQKFSLHYDFGDDWMFTISVHEIESIDHRMPPECLKSKGTIEQYPDPEGDFFTDEDEDEDEDERYLQSQKKNKPYLDAFEQDLQAAGLTEKTIERHVTNMDFYLNEYLPYYAEEENDMAGGPSFNNLHGFFGDFFIRKCMWSTPASIKTTAASIKKFYKCMWMHGFVKESTYRDLCVTIKEEMPYWQEACEEYNESDSW